MAPNFCVEVGFHPISAAIKSEVYSGMKKILMLSLIMGLGGISGCVNVTTRRAPVVSTTTTTTQGSALAPNVTTSTTQTRSSGSY
jgi:hypothetical protein